MVPAKAILKKEQKPKGIMLPDFWTTLRTTVTKVVEYRAKTERCNKTAQKPTPTHSAN